MINTVWELFQLYCFVKITYGIYKFLYGKKTKGKSIAKKVTDIVSHKIHKYLDSHAPKPEGKIVAIKDYKRA